MIFILPKTLSYFIHTNVIAYPVNYDTTDNEYQSMPYHQVSSSPLSRRIQHYYDSFDSPYSQDVIITYPSKTIHKHIANVGFENKRTFFGAYPEGSPSFSFNGDMRLLSEMQLMKANANHLKDIG
ncbi:unnamed protein product [Trichobilharzia szidati]|nr:unnamed protein product [Trichobilharzia szidati]